MTKTEYEIMMLRTVSKLEQIDTTGFDDPENGYKLVETLQKVVNSIKEVVDLYNKEKV